MKIGDKVRVKQTQEDGTVVDVQHDRFGNMSQVIVMHELDLTHDKQGSFKYSPDDLEFGGSGHKLTQSGGRSMI